MNSIKKQIDICFLLGKWIILPCKQRSVLRKPFLSKTVMNFFDLSTTVSNVVVFISAVLILKTIELGITKSPFKRLLGYRIGKIDRYSQGKNENRDKEEHSKSLCTRVLAVYGYGAYLMVIRDLDISMIIAEETHLTIENKMKYKVEEG